MDKSLLYTECLNDLANCTTRQLEQLEKIKGGSKMANDSSRILNELIYKKHWSSVLVIEANAFLGLILCFAGFRLLKTVLFLAGFTVGFLVAYTLSPLLLKTKLCCEGKGKREAHLGLSAVIGVLLGVASLKLYRLGVFVVGQCLGLIVALSVLCTPLHVYFESNVTYSFFMATLSCIFGSLSCKYEKLIVMLATACGGSLAFLYGIDHIARTSFSVAIESLIFRIKDVVFDGLHSEYTNWTYHATALTHYKALHFEKTAIPMFAIWSTMTVLGCLVQYKWTSKENDNETCTSLRSLNCCDACPFSKSDFA